MTKQELEKAIKNGESVWCVYKDQSNIYEIKAVEIEKVLSNTFLWGKEYYSNIKDVYKTKAKAEHYLHHANVTRTEQLPFLTWEEFLDNGEIEFNDVFGQECLLYHNSTEIILSRKYWVDLGYTKHYDFRKKPYELNEENFYKAYDECVRLFKGEV